MDASALLNFAFDHESFGMPTRWHLDESLFSLCSRMHMMAGGGGTAATRKLLFGHRANGGEHDIPSRLDYFVEVTGGEFGEVSRILNARTTLSFYLSVLPPSKVDRLWLELIAGRSSWPRRTIYSSERKTKAYPILKYCPVCSEENLQKLGIDIWRLQHQYPTSVYCPIHGVPLEVQRLVAQTTTAMRWALPVYEERDSQFGSSNREFWIRLSRESVRWAKLAPSSLSDRRKMTRIFRDLASGWNGENVGYGVGEGAFAEAFDWARSELLRRNYGIDMPLDRRTSIWDCVFRQDRPVSAVNVITMSVLAFGTIDEMLDHLT